MGCQAQQRARVHHGAARTIHSGGLAFGAKAAGHPMCHCTGFDAAVKRRNIPTLGRRLGLDKLGQGDGE